MTKNGIPSPAAAEMGIMACDLNDLAERMHFMTEAVEIFVRPHFGRDDPASRGMISILDDFASELEQASKKTHQHSLKPPLNRP